MRRLLILAAYAGLAALQYVLAVAYLDRGAWWHYLLHQMIGWGLGLAVGGVVMALRRGLLVPPIGAALVGQLVSIVPDLMFTYLRMPHTPAMECGPGTSRSTADRRRCSSHSGSCCWAAGPGWPRPTAAGAPASGLPLPPAFC